MNTFILLTQNAIQEHKKQMEAAMDNLETIQKAHQKEIVQIQDTCNQQGTIMLVVTKVFDGLLW